MRRTQVQLDDAAYQALKKKAFERGVSMSALLREILHQQMNPVPARRSLKSFRFVGSGRSEQGALAPVSEHHDEALADEFAQ